MGDRSKHSILLLAGLVLVSSCATRPVTTQTVTRPQSDETFEVDAAAAPEAARWASRFGDPTLDALIAEALEANIGLDAAEANVRAAEAAARISGALKYPGLNLGLASNRQQSRLSFLNFQKIETESHSLSLGAQWEVDVWGRLSRSHAAGLAGFEAAQADVDALKLSIAGQVARAWFNLLESDQQWRLARDSAASLDQKVESLEKRYDRGLATNLEMRLTKAQAASSRAVAQQRMTQLNTAKRALEVLLGRYPSGAQKSGQALPEIDAPIPAGLSSELVARRPDLFAAERRLAAAFAQSQSASRNWLPRLVLTGSTGTTSSELTDLLDTDFSVWTIAGDLSANLFAAGRLEAERDQAQAQADVQLAQYRSAILTAFQEVENALSSESDLAQLSVDTAIAAEENQKAEDLAWEQYQRGLIDITTLLDAQRRADESASQLASVQNQRLQNRINLHLALGGDFE